MNLLNERYYGNIAPVAKCFDQRGEYGEWVRTIAENEEALKIIIWVMRQNNFSPSC